MCFRINNLIHGRVSESANQSSLLLTKSKRPGGLVSILRSGSVYNVHHNYHFHRVI